MQRRSALTLAGASLGALALFGVLAAVPANRADEAWMLWVGHRMTLGDRLYRDVYFVSTPLAAWLAAGVERLVGTELLALRALKSILFIGQLTLGLSAARASGVSPRARVLLALAMLALGSPLVAFTSLYSMLAVLFALLALRFVVRWMRSSPAHPTSPLVCAGASCGLSLGAKPNVGALALIASCVFLTSAGARRGWTVVLRRLAVVTCSALAVAAIVLAPLVIIGSWDAFVSQVLAGRSDYFRVGFSYPHTLSHVAHQAVQSSWSVDPRRRWRIAVVLMPLVVLGELGVAMWRSDRQGRRAALGPAAFSLAALIGVLPRPGVNHFAFAGPLALTAAVITRHAAGPHASRGVPTRRRTGAMIAMTSVLVIAIAAVAAGALGAGRQQPMTTSGIPRFAGVPVPADLRTRIQRLRRGLRTQSDGQVFIVRDDAAFWYLTTGIRDPLPFDYPEVSDLGAQGQAGVIHRLHRGEARWVCLRPGHHVGRTQAALRPVTLETWVRSHFELITQLPGCNLYQHP